MQPTQKIVKIKRYPATRDGSLRAWNAADELLLEFTKQEENDVQNLALYNDRFGYLTSFLHAFRPQIVVNYASQEKAIRSNLELNGMPTDDMEWRYPFDDFRHPIKTALVKIPKSIDLFEFQLQHVTSGLPDDGVVACGFMTRHFTKSWLETAQRYFEEVTQSRAVKKARLLILRKKKPVSSAPLINLVKSSSGQAFKQYYGVFSGQHIDYGSELLMKHWQLSGEEKTVLDLASGNGVLAHAIQKQLPDTELHLLDDDWLAVASSKLNVEGEHVHFHFDDGLSAFAENQFDLVVSNPPFHFSYETNTEISIRLFKEVSRVLKPGGSFQLVANAHLRYIGPLRKWFDQVDLLHGDGKFNVYRCS